MHRLVKMLIHDRKWFIYLQKESIILGTQNTATNIGFFLIFHFSHDLMIREISNKVL